MSEWDSVSGAAFRFQILRKRKAQGFDNSVDQLTMCSRVAGNYIVSYVIDCSPRLEVSTLINGIEDERVREGMTHAVDALEEGMSSYSLRTYRQNWEIVTADNVSLRNALRKIEDTLLAIRSVLSSRGGTSSHINTVDNGVGIVRRALVHNRFGMYRVEDPISFEDGDLST
ncbi:hypothetical protein BKA70DRAFT_1228152 [Coprinopsis sp. MPI-PUGE-AT-0042]|nr:hypothetical protein BKA70DRAFT_1228152 [Coprinopsis sp. MPI-PUGE-AT-0042]